MKVSRFCLDKRVIGTQRHLVYDDGTLSYVDECPADCLSLSGEIKRGVMCLDTLLRLEHVSLVNMTPDERYVKCAKSLAPTLDVVPWCALMGSEAHRTWLKKLLNEVVGTLDDMSMNYYVGTWVPTSVLFDKLVPAKVNVVRLLEHMQSTPSATSVLSTFEPDSEGYAKSIVYDRLKTRTGRLCVASGPQVLTLKREYRDVIVSRYGDDGAIMYVDFSSLEVRIILHESGRRLDAPDIYTKLAQDIFKGRNVDRSVVKAAVISELYGVSPQRLCGILGMGERDVSRFIDVVRAYFDVDALLKRIRGLYARKGYIKNRYGRKVIVDDPVDHMLLNSYVQSTGVDVSLLGFLNIVKALERKAPSAKPLYVLHDAMLLDIHKDELTRLKDVCEKVRVKGYVQSYFLHVDRL